jgi:two-component system response regulator LytT
MKITIDEQPGGQGIEVTILCKRADRQVLDIVARLRMLDRKVTGSVDGHTRIVNAKDVLYVESIDKRTFIYTADEVLETSLRLYEMEERLADCDFLRVAKGCVVNFRRIASLRPDLNGRIVATMDNGEQVVISRQYAPDVKRKLEMF